MWPNINREHEKDKTEAREQTQYTSTILLMDRLQLQKAKLRMYANKISW